MKTKLILMLLVFTYGTISAQADLGTVLKGGEVLVNGLSILLKSKSSDKSDSKFVESVCVKNKLSEKITFTLTTVDGEGKELKKELVVQKNGKECLFELQKGIYAYEIMLSNYEVFKKGEYKFVDEVIITVNPIKE
jgi:hypothetical protein